MNNDIYDNHLCSFPAVQPLDSADVPVFGCVAEVLQPLQDIIGLEVRFIRTGGTIPLNTVYAVTVPVEGGASPGQLVAVKPESGRQQCNNAVLQLLQSIATLLGETYRWQRCVHQQSTSGSGNVPFIPSSNCSLSAVLKQTAKLLDFEAAALYRLNPLEKTLKTSLVWGLPEERILQPQRHLHDSLADVEAVLGQTVIINEDYLAEVWKIPEDFPMAVCAPVISPSTILGTLWLFKDDRRDWSEHDAELLEFAVSRIAAEWELHRRQFADGRITTSSD